LPDAAINENLPLSVSAFAYGAGSEHSEVVETMLRFGRVLTVLEEVGRMLERDEPLKPAILLFAKAHAMTLDLVDHLDRRVARLGETGGDVAESIDSASYTASIELKKAIAQELADLLQTRSAAAVYARAEAAHSLLAESFQQIITVLARQIDPSVDTFEMFPHFRQKLEQSLVLRRELYAIAELTKAAEAKPGKEINEKLIAKLNDFGEGAIKYLYYKDFETFERFIEEIRVTRESKDLVPILHRFGAYLETLFAQVSMRAVLEGHPLET
jgi:hypothetical protein